MIRHQQPGHDLALEDMPLHDLGHIGFRADPVPDPFRIDDDTGAHVTMVEASGFVGAHDAFQIQPFGFTFKVGVEFVRSQVGAAAAGVVFRPLVGTNENMALKWRHGVIGLYRHGGRVEPFHQQSDILPGEQ